MGGFWALTDYSFQSSGLERVGASWPTDIGMRPATDRPTLVMLAHPECPCTRASLEELAVIRARAGDRLDLRVLFVEVAGAETRSATWRLAERIPGAQVAADPGGRAVERFGAVSSGTVVVYSPSGRLLFSGGVTARRGHAGDNMGRAAVLAIARGRKPAVSRAPGFGCALRDGRRGPGDA